MSELKATPGPWRIEPHAKFGDTQMYWVNDFTSVGTGIKPDVVLIAASPDLCDDAEFLCARVRELEQALTDDSEAAREFFGHVIPALARMEASIAKARGEQ